MGDLAKQPQYYLIACGTKDYPSLGEDEALESVETDIEKVVNVLSKIGYKRVLEGILGLNPSRDSLTIKFAEWLLGEDLTETDRVIFYYSGHGVSVEGDQHYLLLKDTKKIVLAQTSLATNELVRPLNNKGVKINQILYIIDTCYAGQGVADIGRFASEVFDRHQPVYSENRKAVHLIAASRLRQPAKPGVFSELFQTELERLLNDDNECTELPYIQPSLLVDRINSAIREQQWPKQQVGHNSNLCEKEAFFFPRYPKNLLDWENNLDDAVRELLDIIGSREKEEALLLMNSFFLMDSSKVDFIFEEAGILEKLRYLGSLPVSNGVCPLVALSEWLKQQFFARNYQNEYDREIINRIAKWQNDLFQCREGISLEKIKKEIEKKVQEFGGIVIDKQPRLQIEVEPEVDADNNTGQATGLYNLYVNLWVRDGNIPLARLAQKKLDPLAFGNNEKSHTDRLMSCLEENKLLSQIVDNTHLILFSERSNSLVLELEFILPFECFQMPVDKISCSYTQKYSTVLGRQYPIFINSYGRYFDEDYFRSKEDVYLKKRRIWEGEDYDLTICYDDDVRFREDEVNPDDFEGDDIFIGSQLPESILYLIEATFPIAVWSRDNSLNLREELVESQWRDWPKQIQALRKQNKNADITLFWDDLYPKPSKKLRPLNTSVVE